MSRPTKAELISDILGFAPETPDLEERTVAELVTMLKSLQNKPADTDTKEDEGNDEHNDTTATVTDDTTATFTDDADHEEGEASSDSTAGEPDTDTVETVEEPSALQVAELEVAKLQDYVSVIDFQVSELQTLKAETLHLLADAEQTLRKLSPVKYRVSEGNAITSSVGILESGREVKEEYFTGGMSVISDLIERGLVIES